MAELRVVDHLDDAAAHVGRQTPEVIEMAHWIVFGDASAPCPEPGGTLWVCAEHVDVLDR
ncbi:hypothetical protein B7755_047520 [Streptomyces sp. NBS 14/10]|uniref:hypothetical protein n=1 Tax=Streptomyces sp. NBS 14/10 TaxID=1945643 RepID=UPI00211B3646|nr:hypothetical protein [Streptomyces sp. NBS 14/10]KAK1185076.1 hypothetical protein B7755_047520 [Streptomyces sp. NBS 14/10]